MRKPPSWLTSRMEVGAAQSAMIVASRGTPAARIRSASRAFVRKLSYIASFA